MNNLKLITKKLIPSEVKWKLQKSKVYKKISAIKLAKSSKRLDLCAAQFALVLHLAKISSLENKVCCEIGGGWVLSHALILYLLGAKKVIVTDIENNAYPPAIYSSIHNAVPSMVRDILAPFEEHSQIRERLNHLLSIKNWSFEVLQDLGIEYIAPIDWISKPKIENIDFIYSFSVLEHIPKDDVLKVIQNLSDVLNDEKGMMIHCVHLEDHKNIYNEPFEFLKEPQEIFTRELESDRGNRIRKSGWETILLKIKDIKFEFLYEWNRVDKKLPSFIDSSIQYQDDDDLKISHLAILGQKSEKL